MRAAAEAVGVDRSTVHRWLREDWCFQAAFNAAQRDLRREIEGRLLQLATSAVDVVAGAIQQGDLRAALAVLKGTGVLAGNLPPIGAESPDELAEDADVAAGARASDRLMRSISTF